MSTTHNATVSTLALRPGDSLIANGGRKVASVEGNANNLGAALIRFTDGSWFHAGRGDAHVITREFDA